MTIEQAFEEASKSDESKAIAKTRDSIGGKYRSYLSRFNTGNLKAGAIVEILLGHGYEIKVGKATKKK